jgi:sugar phosphate isomerase/epimerase
MQTDDLIASCWTTAGDAAPLRGAELSPHSLIERAGAASDAGFRGFGLLYADLVAAREQHGYREMRSIFEDHGLVHIELEFLGDWWTSGPRRAASDAVRRELLDAAEALGARHIKVGPDLGREPWDPDHWTSEFAQLAEDAEEAGTKVALEFLPMANLANLRDGLRVVQGADHPAGGLAIDIWHVERSGTPRSELAQVPLRYVTAVELDDAAPQPVESLWEDTIDKRRLCGDGAFDLQGFISTMRDIGWTGPWGVEILSEEHRRRPISEAVADAYRTATHQLALATARQRA